MQNYAQTKLRERQITSVLRNFTSTLCKEAYCQQFIFKIFRLSLIPAELK